MGPVRELDVARRVLEATAAVEEWPTSVVAALDAAGERRRARAARAMMAKLERLDDRAVLQAVDAVRSAVEGDEVGQVWTKALAQRVRTRAADLASAIDHAGTLYVAAPLHEIRLAAKKLRYSLEIVPAGSVWRTGSARGRLRRAQTSLGALSDLQIAQHEVQRFAARSGGLRATRQALAVIDRHLEARCRATHANILRSLPGLRTLSGRLARASALEAFPLRAARMIAAPPAGVRRQVSDPS